MRACMAVPSVDLGTTACFMRQHVAWIGFGNMELAGRHKAMVYPEKKNGTLSLLPCEHPNNVVRCCLQPWLFDGPPLIFAMFFPFSLGTLCLRPHQFLLQLLRDALGPWMHNIPHPSDATSVCCHVCEMPCLCDAMSMCLCPWDVSM